MSRVVVNRDGIFVDNRATVILCGSLFYYRVPHHLWEDRMRKIKRAGYNCIDVYFPWNFHELREGEWDFSGDRDVERFLRLARQYELYVVARPGPYICGEWDGGGLPAYLHAKGIKVRDCDETFLGHVDQWYRRIVPVIAKYQLDQDGTVLAFQLENELDFYKRCEDPGRYIERLREMAEEYGITVPVFACVGNFDIERATGLAEGVMPTMNIYPDLGTPKLEARTVHYYKYMRERDYPLMVTETNRDHHLLRRLMLNGAKLLGPFNQVGGTCFGFTNAINNWGRPLSFLASDYNFGGLINGQGEVSEEFYEARLLSNFIRLFKEKLGRSRIVEKEIEFIGKDDIKSYPHMLELHDGGYVATATNYSNELESIKVKIEAETYPKNCDIELKRLKAPFLLWNTPLDFLGIEAEIVFSSLELSQHFRVNDRHVLVTYTDHVGEMQLRLPKEAVQSIRCNGRYEFEGERLIVNLSAGESCYINADRFDLTIYALTPKCAALVDQITQYGVTLTRDELVKGSRFLKPLITRYHRIPLERFCEKGCLLTTEVKRIEQYGHFRGYANYHFRFAGEGGIVGLLVNEVSDVCSVYLNDVYLGTSVVCNNHHYVSLDRQSLGNDNSLVIRTEIWGHTNFHDAALPSLHLDSLKGLSGVTVIKHQEELHGSWSDDAQTLTVHLPYAKKAGTCAFLRLSLSHRATVKVNGQEAGRFGQLNNVVGIGGHLSDGDNVIEIRTDEPGALSHLELLLGERAHLTGVNFIEEEDLEVLLNEPEQVPVGLPLSVKPGELAALTVELPQLGNRDAYLYPKGKNLKLTAFYNGRLVSRVWLDSPNRPFMVGGNPNMVYLPSHPVKSDNRAVFFVEAVNKDEGAILDDLIVSVLDS
ncbi:MAG: hypothetical protein GXX08_11145 [Firmicutes bacterium]|nr:hypothetical protein [Bacillota bacterium]